MKSEAAIRFNFNKAVNQANQLSDLAVQLKQLANNNLDQTMVTVSHSWSGDSASLFLGKCGKAKEDILKTANQLEQTASAIKRAAQKVKQAEEAARQIALQRLYKK